MESSSITASTVSAGGMCREDKDDVDEKDALRLRCLLGGSDLAVVCTSDLAAVTGDATVGTTGRGSDTERCGSAFAHSSRVTRMSYTCV